MTENRKVGYVKFHLLKGPRGCLAAGSGAGDQGQGRERKRFQNKGTDQDTGGQEHSLVVAHLKGDRYMKRVEFTPGASQPADIVRGGGYKSTAKPRLETSAGVCMSWISSL